MEKLQVQIKKDGMYMKFDPATGKAKPVFRYTVHGSEEAVAAYAKSQGTNLRKKDLVTKGDGLGAPMFFSTRTLGNAATLEQSDKGNWFANQEALHEANSLAEQFPALASEIARRAVGSIFGSGRSTAVVEEEGAKKNEENIQNA